MQVALLHHASCYGIRNRHTHGPADLIEAYARTWPPERTSQESKEKLGTQDRQTQLPQTVAPRARFTIFLYSLVVLWYVIDNHRITQALTACRDPWYDKRTRLSFSDMLACLRRASWVEAFVDLLLPPSPQPSQSLAIYLMRMVALR